MLAILVVVVSGIFVDRVLELPSRPGLLVVVVGSATIGAATGLIVWRRGDFEHETQEMG